MAEALRITVDKNVYKETLGKLEAELNSLRNHENRLQIQIERLKSGGIFSGSDVRVAIKKAEDALEKVRDAISRVMGYKVTIEEELAGVTQVTAQLATDMGNIDLPNMFS